MKKVKGNKKNQKDNNNKRYKKKANMRSLFKWSLLCVGQPFLGMGLAVECDWCTQWDSIGKSWFSISRQILIANNLWVTDDTLCLPLLHCLVWTCAKLVHAVAATVSLYLNQPYCIWEMLLESTLCFWDSNKTTFSPSLPLNSSIHF